MQICIFAINKSIWSYLETCAICFKNTEPVICYLQFQFATSSGSTSDVHECSQCRLQIGYFPDSVFICKFFRPWPGISTFTGFKRCWLSRIRMFFLATAPCLLPWLFRLRLILTYPLCLCLVRYSTSLPVLWHFAYCKDSFAHTLICNFIYLHKPFIHSF